MKKRIELLQDFYNALKEWHSSDSTIEEHDNLRSFLNRNLVAVKNAVIEAGVHTFTSIGTIDGTVSSGFFDPFSNLFRFEVVFQTPDSIITRSKFITNVLDQVEQAIGVYEHIEAGSGLIDLNPREAIDIVSAIQRSLRPAFRNDSPNSEKEVQDEVETIFNALGIEFSREREIASVAGKYVRPDFIVTAIDLAVEVKFAKKGRGVAELQEEINADITAYKTKWKNLLFVIYDLGVITDPHKFRQDNIKLFGISVVVVKH